MQRKKVRFKDIPVGRIFLNRESYFVKKLERESKGFIIITTNAESISSNDEMYFHPDTFVELVEEEYEI